MAANDTKPILAALRGLEESLGEHMRGNAEPAPDATAGPQRKRRGYDFGFVSWVLRAVNEIPYLHVLQHLRHLRRLGVLGPHLRRAAVVVGGVICVGAIGFGILWWRLSSGPISLDMATPWITAAIEQNFGARHKVDIGGTILERDEQGRTAVRLRDIVVRDPDGIVDGLLIPRLTAREKARLRIYEGERYRLARVRVRALTTAALKKQLPAGRPLTWQPLVWAKVFAARGLGATARPWLPLGHHARRVR